ncbi:MAG: aminomethyl-transferring glycine dehydrogenase, partial [Saprospiraceae bacterium]|nr:aminomethyl-transferring glycine dehydrogenase [Saprospiraceae bacterium]
ISQGRLEALLNFQTVVADLTGLPIANASLLDEGTAAAEAMAMFYSLKNKRNKKDSVKKFFVDQDIFPSTLSVLLTRAEPLDIELEIGSWKNTTIDESYFGVLLQYPSASGSVEDYSSFANQVKKSGAYVTVAADLLSLAILRAPGEWGADAVVGNTQRFGVPIGFGGPHAAYFATHEDHKRVIPGRIIGVSRDSQGNTALRMALQTREQHIRREKATSNICTAQALLAIMAGMYAVYHGPEGLRDIAEYVHTNTRILAKRLSAFGLSPSHENYFDTLHFKASAEQLYKIRNVAEKEETNFFYGDDFFQISLDETVDGEDLDRINHIFEIAFEKTSSQNGISIENLNELPESLSRKTEYLIHPVFTKYHTETEMMRYIKRLENKDLSLVHSMIALGSCTMKLNAASELIPVSWPEFADLHPFVPPQQAQGYLKVFTELESYLCEITGFSACSLQPNSGAQGEYAGLLTIRAYHKSRGEGHRNIALIPSSAHGTNPASAVMAGMKVVVVKCDEDGNILVDDLKEKAELHKDNLASLMVTYPSTHGVFEVAIKEICDIIHDCGGKIYMDGANMNAQVGLTSPGIIHADVCHLNLHKTFAIPHGGGGPGMGPICVNDSLAPFLPGHPLVRTGGNQAIHAVSSAPWGSASILLISYAYIKMLGRRGMIDSTEAAILNANYIKARLEKDFPVLYTGENDRVAHELIVDLRQFKSVGISAEDVAKRLIDYGFHSPTLSFPVAGTIMIEPTESESKVELDRFCEAMINIRKEIDEVARGEQDPKNNVLVNSPHTLEQLSSDEWELPYPRSKAAFPVEYLRSGHKFWPAVGRVDNAYGDRNLVCICPPIEDYLDEEISETLNA